MKSILVILHILVFDEIQGHNLWLIIRSLEEAHIKNHLKHIPTAVVSCLITIFE